VNYRKLFLIAFICSVAAAAGIGILGIVSSRWGEPKLLGTMMSIALFSLTALGSAIVLDKRIWRPLMSVSFGTSAIGLAMFIFMIYFDSHFDWPVRQVIGQSSAIIATIAVALPLGGLLALTRFEQPMLLVLRFGGIALVFLTALVICAGVLEWIDDEPYYFKFLGIMLILSALATVCLPVLHKVAGMPPPSETVASDVSIEIVCPRCSMKQSVHPGPSRCAQCRLKFAIEVEEPRCPKCRYLLYQLTEPRCPECGTAVDDAELVPPIRTSELKPAAIPPV
jgi:hypothetical protein